MKKFILNLSFELLISIFLFFILSIILYLTNISEKIIIPFIIAISFISIFCGSFNFTNFKGKNGIIYGGLLGISYISILYIISSIINSDFRLNTNSIIMLILCVLSGVLGGIFGVNFKMQK